MSNKSRRLYVGAATDLIGRAREHRTGKYPNAFTARYKFYKLVYYEPCVSFAAALKREKQIKGWTRAKRVALIQSVNEWWHDLTPTLLDLLEAR